MLRHFYTATKQKFLSAFQLAAGHIAALQLKRARAEKGLHGEQPSLMAAHHGKAQVHTPSLNVI
jgi:hypothetical protein